MTTEEGTMNRSEIVATLRALLENVEAGDDRTACIEAAADDILGCSDCGQPLDPQGNCVNDGCDASITFDPGPSTWRHGGQADL